MKLVFKSMLSVSLGCFALGLASPSPISAATLVWDSDSFTTLVQDGSGTWNEVNMNWYDATNGPTSWTGSGGHVAAFGSAVSADKVTHIVSVSGSVLAHGLQFNAIGEAEYRLNGGSVSLYEMPLENGFDFPRITLNHKAAVLAVNLGGNVGFTLSANNQANRLSLSGAMANSYQGVTYLNSGELFLDKTSGINAINDDVIINGGTLRWNNHHQLADTASVTLNSGTLFLASKTETFKNLTFNGGTSNGGTASNGGILNLTGTLTVGSSSSSIGLNSNAQWSANKVVFAAPAGPGATQAFTATGNGTSISTLTVGSGGLEIHNRTVVFNTGTATSAKGSQILLQGDVISSGGASFSKNGSYYGVGQIDIENAVRTWTVLSDTTTVNVSIVGGANAGLTKKGNGVLLLGSNSTTQDEANTYGGMTTIEGGTIKMFKYAGINTISGDITVKTGGILDWDQANQVADTSSIYLQGGSLRTDSMQETIANLYQSAGTVNLNNDSASGVFNVTGTLQVSGGSTIVLNSGAVWSAGRFEALASMTGTVLGLNGNSSTVLNRFSVGAGGMSLTGQNVNLAKATTSTGKGSELTLGGDFTGSGNNNINTTGGTYGVAQLNLQGSERVFHISSGETSLNVNVISTAGATALTKRGSGTLTLGRDNSYGGNTSIESGTLRLSSTGSIHISPRITVLSGATFDVASVTAGYRLISGQTLEGGGTISGNATLASGSVLSAGVQGADVTQALSFDANLTLETGAQVHLDLGLGGDHDQLNITGNLLQQNGAKITVLANGVSAQEGQSYQLFQVGGSSSFSSLIGSLYRTGAEDNSWDFDLPDIAATGLLWDLSQLSTMGRISVVPEPSKSGLVLLGLTLFGLRRKREL